MNSDRHTQNRLASPSHDDYFCESVVQVLEFLSVAGAKDNYACIGSCAIQTQLRGFYRLPNDIDLVVRAADEAALQKVARELDIPWRYELGRASLVIGNLPVHIVPEEMKIVDNIDKVIFETIDLSDYASGVTAKEIRLLGSERSVQIRVFPLEVLYFVELLRPPYTGSVYNTVLIFSSVGFDDKSFCGILRANPRLALIARERLKRYEELVLKVPYFGGVVHDVSERLATLREYTA